MSRTLTWEEIQDIITYIPLPESMDMRDDGQRQLVHKQQCDVLVSILNTIKIHPDGINELGESLRRAWNRSAIDPGTTVGMLASQAIAQPATQGKLKNFSHSGTIRSRSYDADRLNELLKVVGTQRFRNMTIVFNDPYITYPDILMNYRHKLVEITLRKLVTNFEIVDRNNAEIFDITTKDWWSNYCYIFNMDLNMYSPKFLRLQLDVVTMAKYKVTMRMIHDALITGENMEFIGVIYSPFDYGILDIFVSPNAEISIKIAGNKTEKKRINDENTFFDNVIIPSIVKTDTPDSEIQVSGVKDIVDMLPVELPLHALFTNSLDRGRGIYDIYVNKRQESLYGVPRQRLKEALKEVDAKIVKIPDSELVYKDALPLFIRCQCDSDPVKKLGILYKSLKFEKDGVNYKNWYDPQYHRLVYCYGETEGNNLRDVLSIPGINKRHTISNDLREVRDVLGIEAAKNLITQEIMIVCETIGFVHPSHVMLASSTMTRNGTILPVNHQGTSKNLGPMTNMGFERATESIMNSSIGANEYVASSTTIQATGRIGNSGTGALDVYDEPEDSEFKPKIVLTSLPISAPERLTKTVSLSGIRRPVIQKPVDRDICIPHLMPAVVYTFSDENIPMPIIYSSPMYEFTTIVNNIGLYNNVVLY